MVVITASFYEKSLDKYEKNIEIIKKYIKLGVIKKFKVKNWFEDSDDDEWLKNNKFIRVYYIGLLNLKNFFYSILLNKVWIDCMLDLHFIF